MRVRKAFVGLVLVLLVAGLVGCVKADITVVFEPDQNWTTTTDIVFNQETLESLAEMSGEEIDLTETESELDAAVQEIQSMYGDQGVTAEWISLPPTESGEVGYRMIVKGQGYDLLNQAMFEGEGSITAEQRGDREVVVFSLPGLGNEFGNQEEMEQMSAMMGLPAPELRFSVEGSEIVESNGEIDGNKAVWLNHPGPYEAVLVAKRPAPELDLGVDLGIDLASDLGVPNWAWWAGGVACCCGAILVVAAVVALIVFLTRRNRQKKEEEAAALPPDSPPSG